MEVELLKIPWKTFEEEMPNTTDWIWVVFPKGNFLQAQKTILMQNCWGGGYSFYHAIHRYVKSCPKWKWCYEKDIHSRGQSV